MLRKLHFPTRQGTTEDTFDLRTLFPLGRRGTPAAFAVAKVLSDVIAQGLLSLLILLLFSWFCSLELWLVNRNWEVDFSFFEFISPCSRGVVIVGIDNSYDNYGNFSF